MQETTTADHLARCILNGALALIAGVAAAFVLMTKTSDGWQLVGMVLGIFALIFLLALAVSALVLLAGLAATWSMWLVNEFLTLFRFSRPRRYAVQGSGLLIAGAGFPLVWSYDPRFAFIPVTIGFTLMRAFSFFGWLRHRQWWQLIFGSGRKPQAEFAQAYHLVKVAKPFRSQYRTQGGFCSDDLFLGTSTWESS